MKKTRLAALIVATASVIHAAAAPASTTDLSAFLERAERMYAPAGAARAEITITDADGSKDKAQIIIDPAAEGHLFFARKSTGFRALVPLAWDGAGYAIDNPGASARAIGADDPLGGSDLRAIDFFPFWKTDYSTAFISDQNDNEKTVSLYAQKSRPYLLYVVTFDNVKLVPRVLKYYRDSYNNMVRIRSDDGLTMVGSRPRATKITVTDYSESTTRSYDLQWEVLDALPAGLFSKLTFATAELNW